MLHAWLTRAHCRPYLPLPMNINITKKLVSTLAGTVATHQCYIFLHATRPPSEFPSKFSTQLQRMLQLKVMKWGGIVNFAWSKEQPTLPQTEQNERYCATAYFSTGTRMDIPELSLANLDEVETSLHACAASSVEERDQKCFDDNGQDIHLYVCTHGARDCRCGEHGTQFVNALRTEYQHLLADGAPQLNSTRVHIAEVAHVGGHKYAANLLVFPRGDWLGELRSDRAKDVLHAILEKHSRRNYADTSPLLPQHWRGRMGLNKEEQLEVIASCLPPAGST